MRATLDRQAQAPRTPVPQAPALQAPVLQAPQMAPPLHQPLPSSRGQPATLYQQAVQPPSKSTGLGVTFDSSTNKPAATGGQDADGCGRQSTRGRDDNGQPASCSRGMQERSSVRMTSKQMPCQVGERSSGAPHNVPPASTPESTPPQHGGGVRASPKGALHDSRIPPDWQCSRNIESQPGTPGGGERFAASHRGLRSGWHVPGNEGREGCREGQDPPNRYLAAPPRYGSRGG